MSDAEKAPTRIQKKNQAAIMAAGLDAFAQYGFRGSTLDQIAEKAGMSKPNLLYYFPSKEAVYTALLEKQLKIWLDPLIAIDPKGDPVEEIVAYAMRKLDMSRDTPRESRLWANEIIQGAPNIQGHLAGTLRQQTNAMADLMNTWMDQGKIAKIDPHHLLFSIWAMTQHYADFDVQVRIVLETDDPFDSARAFIDQAIRAMLRP